MSTEYTHSHTLMGNTTHIPEFRGGMQQWDAWLLKDNHRLRIILMASKDYTVSGKLNIKKLLIRYKIIKNSILNDKISNYYDINI